MENIIETAQSEKRTVTFRGEPYALVGEVPAVGSPAPDFTVYGWQNASKVEITLTSLLANRTPILLSVFASVDTPVSRLQLKNFDNALAHFGDLVIGVHISSDLPFTVGKTLRNEEIGNLMGLSDYLDRNFGRAYGVLVEDPQVLARAVFVIDSTGVLRYAEVLPEVTFEPDYNAALDALAGLVSWPEPAPDDSEPATSPRA